MSNDIGVHHAWITFDAEASDWSTLARNAARDVLSMVPEGAEVLALDDIHPHPQAEQDYYLFDKKVRVMVKFDIRECKFIGRAYVAYRIS